MTLTLAQLLLILLPILVTEGIFAGSEIALLSADKLRLQSGAKGGSPGARLALELARHPERVLSATLIMTSLCMIAISTLVTLYFIGNGMPHAELSAIAASSPLIVIFGELIPKTLYQRFADRLAPWVAYPVSGVFWALYPLTRILSSYTHRLSRILGPIEEMMTGKRRNTREEIRSLLSYSKKESEIKASEKRMIKRIFDFKDTEAKHALIPLVKVEAIADTATVREALDRFQTHRHSRMPVYGGRVDNIVGLLEIADLFTVSNLALPIRNYITPANYVAETQALEDLLADMNREDSELVVIVDEYGGAVGILTLEDIVEEIVGEIQDEYDTENLPWKTLSDKAWHVQARAEVSLLNEQLALEIPEGDYETLGGFLLQQFGRIPEPSDELFFDTPGSTLRFVVRKASPRQIEAVLVERVASKA